MLFIHTAMLPQPFPESPSLRAFLADRIIFLSEYLSVPQEALACSVVPCGFRFDRPGEEKVHVFTGPDGRQYAIYPYRRLGHFVDRQVTR